MVVKAAKIYSPEDLLTMPDGDRYELIDGQLVEKVISFKSSYVSGRAYAKLNAKIEPVNLGWLAPEGVTYQCFRDDPKRVRKADVSFIELDRLTDDQFNSEGHCTVVPDLAVEVISPNDHSYDVERKAEEWLEAGVRVVWIIHPEIQTVRVLRRDGSDSRLHIGDTLTCEELLPGFTCPVAALFDVPRREVSAAS
jgi:Uma2 family endonuclease